MAEVLKKFGRYFLLDHIAQGGMAEIYRARLAAPDGAGRLMVIKRIQAGFGTNTEFLQMFRAETRVTMGLNHPNIVQLYDYGEEQSQPYIVMEWVDGKNLRQFMSRFGETKQAFPIELAAYIVEQAAGGLHYAHNFKDKISGQALQIVHRDISPQNILISFEGTVKIIDFGIAKAATNAESTRAGVIKGKPSYLAPEQISGDPLDGRCDLFALGTVLWELLTGKKLFAGENDLAVLKLIESVQTHVKPPSTLNPKVPKELDYIVLRALAKQREKRFQNGEEMARALHKFLYAYQPDFNPQDLSYYAKDLFKDDIVEDRKRILRLNDKVEQLLAADVPDLSRPSVSLAVPAESAKREDTTTIVEARVRGTGAREFDEPRGAQKGIQLEMERRSARSTGANGLPASRGGFGPTGASARGSGTIYAANPRGSQTAPPRANTSGGGGGLSRALAATAAIAAGVIFAPQFGFQIPGVSEYTMRWTGVGAPLEVPSRGTASTPAATGTAVGAIGGEAHSADNASAKQGTIQVRFTIVPGCGGTVTLNGKVLPTITDAHGLASSDRVADVALDAPLELAVDRPGYKSFRKEFQMSSRDYGALREAQLTETLEPLEYGKLTLSSQPTADQVFFTSAAGGGCTWRSPRGLPFQDEHFPPGDYKIRLVNTVLGAEKEIFLRIEKNSAPKREVSLDFRN